MPKTVLFIIASMGYNPIEYTVPKKILENAGFTVVTASNVLQTAVASHRKQKADVSITLNQADVKNFLAVVFIGGVGTLQSLDHMESYRVAQDTVDNRVILAAICRAP